MLDAVHQRPRLGCVLGLHQRLERQCVGLVARAANADHMRDGGDRRPHRMRETGHVELRIVAVDEMDLRACVISEIANFRLPVRGKRGDRDDAQLKARDESIDHLLAVADLEQRAVPGAQAEPVQCRRAAIADLVQLAIGHLHAGLRKRDTVRVPRKALAQRDDECLVGQHASRTYRARSSSGM